MWCGTHAVEGIVADLPFQSLRVLIAEITVLMLTPCGLIVQALPSLSMLFLTSQVVEAVGPGVEAAGVVIHPQKDVAIIGEPDITDTVR